MSKIIELQRSNITLSSFLNTCKIACKNKETNFDLDKEEFENPTRTSNSMYYVKDNKRICKIDGYTSEEEISENPYYKSEIYRVQPLNYQTYFLTFDESSCYNEICEFTFDDDKTGHGYYYRVEKNL